MPSTQLQAAVAFAGDDTPFAGGRAESRDLLAQRANRHGKESRQVRAGHRLDLVALTRLKLPPGNWRRVAELRLGQLDSQLRAIGFLIGQAHRQEVAFPYPELECAARQFNRLNRLGSGRGLEDAARHLRRPFHWAVLRPRSGAAGA